MASIMESLRKLAKEMGAPNGNNIEDQVNKMRKFVGLSSKWKENDLTDVWKIGGLTQSGSTMDSNKRVRTAAFIDVSGRFKVYIADGYKLRIAYYDDAKEAKFVGFSDWMTEGGEITPLARYCKLLGGRVDDSIIVEDDLPTIDEKLKLLEFISEEADSPFKGLTVAVLGDSISTNGNDGENFNVPEAVIGPEDVGESFSAYVSYYDVQAGLKIGDHTFVADEIGTEVLVTPAEGDVGKKIGLPNNYNAKRITVWWEHMEAELGCKVIPVCWSGASITSHEVDDPTKKFLTAEAWHEAQIRKCGTRVPGSSGRIPPDVIIIYRGTNDFSHSPYTALTNGYFDNPNWTYPVTDEVVAINPAWKRGGIYPSTGKVIPTGDEDTTNRARTIPFNDLSTTRKIHIADGYKAKIAYYEDESEGNYVGIDEEWLTEDTVITPLARYGKIVAGYTDDRNVTADMLPDIAAHINFVSYGFKEGLVLTIKKLRDAYPNAKIFLCTLNVFKRINYTHFPTNNGVNSLPQYNDAIREVANFMGCGLIEFDKDGITFENCYSDGYITDSATNSTHPSDKGHMVMGRKAIADFKAQYSKMG